MAEMSLGAAISQVMVARGEKKPFTIRVPDPNQGKPQCAFDSKPLEFVDVPADVVSEAKLLVTQKSKEK